MSQRKKIDLKKYVDALVDKDGLKTEVTITLTKESALTILGILLGSGLTLTLVYHLMKNHFPNKQLMDIQRQLKSIRQTLNT